MRRMQMLRQCYCYQHELDPIINARVGSAMYQLLQERPDVLGVIVWPYLCKDWDVTERLRHVSSHYNVIDEIGQPFPFSIADRLLLADLSDHHADLKLMLDQPRWFKREGGLTLNMFVGDFRAYSIAYSYYTEEDGRRSVYIGSLQGRNTDESLDLYRDLTKSLYGVRPRDLLIYALQILCVETNTQCLYAVSDECRHHRHPYFKKKDLGTNYNTIWEDRSGTRVNEQFFELPVAPYRRDIEDVKPKKRSLYKRRYEFMDDLHKRMVDGLECGKLVRFVDK